MTKNKHFIGLSFTFLFLFIGIYLYAFFYQIGSPVKASWWIKNTYQYKDSIGSSMKNEKIIIAGGSNTLFGISSQVIEEQTGYKVLNLGGHAALDIDFLYHKIKEHIQEGDIIVLPLEFEMYTRDKLTEIFINNMLAWGYEDYISELSIFEMIDFIKSTPEKRILEGVLSKLDQNKEQNSILSQSEVVKNLDALLNTDGPRWEGYSFKSLNKYGDINVNKPPIDSLKKTCEKGITYIDSKPVNQHFLTVYFKIKEMVLEKQAKLILTWPVTIRNKSFDLTKNKFQKITDKLVVKLKKHDIDIKCNPTLFNFDIKYFFNTLYHTNKYGAIMRSENLSECIINIIKNPDYEQMDMATAIKLVQNQEKFYSFVESPGDSLGSDTKKRIIDLKTIKYALKKYYDDNGNYPKSKGFDGLYAQWGESRKDWIQGLAPKYIDTLPRDPKKHKNPKEQYFYRSNGQEYKIIAHGVKNCKSVKQTNPELIDLKRDCWAYGYWTEGAKEW